MSDSDRIRYSLEHIIARSVVTFPRSEWSRLVEPTGTPTRLVSAPPPLSRVAIDAKVLLVAASGVVNDDPGIDIVRHDPADAPYIYNIDHYAVIENLHLHPTYRKVLRVAGVPESAALGSYLRDNVFMVGPYQLDYHHVIEIPQQIARSTVIAGGVAPTR